MQVARRLPSRAESETQLGQNAPRRPTSSVKLVATSTRSGVHDARVLSDLLVATSRGDRLAFARLYELTSRKLFAVALRVLKRREVAEEILQDAYLSIWQQAGQHRPGHGSPFGWMVTVVRHRAIDRLRSDGRSAMQTRTAIEAEIPGSGLDSDESMMLDCLNDSVRGCIDQLPMNQRNAVLAAFFHGLSHDELAQRLGVPLGTAKSWVRRGLSQLRGCLESGEAC